MVPLHAITGHRQHPDAFGGNQPPGEPTGSSAANSTWIPDRVLPIRVNSEKLEPSTRVDRLNPRPGTLPLRPRGLEHERKTPPLEERHPQERRPRKERREQVAIPQPAPRPTERPHDLEHRGAGGPRRARTSGTPLPSGE